jgi:hypothetical protein
MECFFERLHVTCQYQVTASNTQTRALLRLPITVEFWLTVAVGKCARLNEDFMPDSSRD